MAFHPPKHDSGPALCLPFGGLGLDLALVRRKVSGLQLLACPREQAPSTQARPHAPPAVSGYRLLVRLGRETLGS